MKKMLKAFCFIFFIVITVQAQGTHDPQFKKPVPCKELTAGNYVYGCSRFYSMCTNGFEHTMHCFDGLVLNPDNNHCEDPRDVWVCQNQQPGALYRTRTPFTCEGKKDGDYEADSCSSHYFQCHSGIRYERECSVTLVYNPAINGCDFPSNCQKKEGQHSKPIKVGNHNSPNQNRPSNVRPALRRNFNARRNAAPTYVASVPSQVQPIGTPSTPVEDTFIIAQPKVPPYPPVVIYNDETETEQAPEATIEQDSSQDIVTAYNEPQAPVADEPTFDCSNKADGIHLLDSKACAKTFWMCANSRAFEYECPTGLFYDVHSSQCNHAEFVPACGGQSTTTSTTTAPKTTVSPYECAGKTDGYYQHEPCTPTFFSCSSGFSTALTCAPGTVFDTSSFVCEYPADCGKPKPTAPVQDVQEHGSASFYYGKNSPISPIVSEPTTTTPAAATTTVAYKTTTTTQASKPVFNCTDKADGYYYKKKCTASFIICSKGQLSQQVCPEGLLFDPDLVVCHYKDECGKSKPPKTTTVATTTAETPILVETTPAIKFDCKGKTDGYHVSQPCTSTFFACASGVAIQLSCPPTLVFDSNTLICEFPDVCGTQTTTVALPTTSTTTQPLPPPQSDDVASNPYAPPAAPNVLENPPTLPPVPVVTTASTFDCQGQSDGYYYTQPCSNNYYTCVNGQATQIQCPASLVFDPVSVVCEYAEVCGQEKTKTTQKPPVAVTVTSNANDYEVSATNVPKKNKKSFSCANRSDGFYLKKNCASSFYTCTSGVATKTICPAGLVLDIATGTCEYPESCGKTPQTPVPVQDEPNTTPVPSSTAKITIKFNCANKENGQYPIGSCQANYIVCAHGVAHSYACPIGLVYDEKANICQYKDQCGLSTSTFPSEQPESDQSYANVQPIPIVQKVSTETPTPAAVENNCGAIPLGTHAAAPCSSRYVSCSNGRLTQGVCFGSLIYNQANGYCDSPQNVPACKPASPPSPSPPPPVLVAPSVQATVANEPVSVIPAAQRKLIRKH